MQNMRILHVPYNVPYIQKLHLPGSFVNANGDLSTPTFSWIANQHDQQFWDGFDVCHIHFGFEFEPIETVGRALELLSSRRKAIVFTVHEVSSVHGITSEQYSQYIDLVLRHSVKIITLTESAKRILAERFAPRNAVAVIPHGRVADVSTPEGDQSINLDAPRILLCGALRSNREMAATFVNTVLASDGVYHTHFVTRPFTADQLRGDGVLQTAINLHGRQYAQVRTVLPLSDEDIVKLFLSCDVLVLPYKEAGHSGQLELAFDCGLPTVSSNVGFLPDQLLAWPIDDRDSISLIDWSDGKTWLYQQRLVAVVKHVSSTLSRERRADTIRGRRKFRLIEHERILTAHADLYREAIKLTKGVE